MASQSLLDNTEKPSAHSRSPSTTSTNYLKAFTRSLRLLIIPAITKWKQGEETAKVAIYRNRKIATLQTIPHFIPLSTSIILIALTLRGTYIGHASTKVLTALQFAAKLLEITMQASIAAILLSFVRWQILGPTPFPLGGLMAPYRTKELSFLWSLDLWGCLTSDRLRSWRKALTCIVLPACTILTTLIGPSGAVLLIPHPIEHLAFRGLAITSWEVGFPEYIDLVTASPRALGSDFRPSLDAVISTYNFDSTKSSYLPAVVYGSSNSRFFQLGQTTETDEDGYEITISASTVPTDRSVRLASSFFDENIHSGYVHSYEPYVVTRCTSVKYKDVEDPQHAYLRFPGRFDSSDLISISQVFPDMVDPYYLEINRTEQVNFTNQETSYYYGNYSDNASFAIFWRDLPLDGRNHSLLTATAWKSNLELGVDFAVSTCVVDAFWSLATTNVTYGSSAINTPVEQVINSSSNKAIHLKPDWAASCFNISFDENVEPGHINDYMGSMFALALSWISHSDYPRATADPSVVDAFGNLKFGGGDVDNDTVATITKYVEEQKRSRKFDKITLLNGFWTNPSYFIGIPFETYQTEYGYSRSTITVQLSLTVLCTYVIICTFYLLHSLVTGWTATSWDSVIETVTLALNSERPCNLQSTSTGVDTISSFRQAFNVRVNAENSLEMLFDDEDPKLREMYTIVRPNRKYD